MTVKRFFVKRVTEHVDGLLVLGSDFDALKAELAEYEMIDLWVASQPCENPIPDDQDGCQRCRKCIPCKMVAKLAAEIDGS